MLIFPKRDSLPCFPQRRKGTASCLGSGRREERLIAALVLAAF